MKSLDFKIYVQPGAKTSEVAGLHDGLLKIRLKSTPIDGKANEELVRFVASHLSRSKSRVEILKGGQSRRKTLRIYDFELDELKNKIPLLDSAMLSCN
ncbi:MAG: DUF167 domain-containing protein [Bdellovibrionales bacterium]